MKVFITGICGTLGTALAKLHKERGDTVTGCTRGEDSLKNWKGERGEFDQVFIADAVSLAIPHTSIGRLLSKIDRVYHCAAMKHVDLCEANPGEAMYQNVGITEQIALACEEAKVPLVFISSDKAVYPTGVYGATKLLAEKCVLRLGGSVVRLGNLIGSSGSVFQLWEDAVANGQPIKLTHPDMTRYFISVEQAADVIVAHGTRPLGEPIIPANMKVVRMGDVAEWIYNPPQPETNTGADSCIAHRAGMVQTIGLRPGETMHQWIDETHCSKDAPRWDINELLKVAGVV